MDIQKDKKGYVIRNANDIIFHGRKINARYFLPKDGDIFMHDNRIFYSECRCTAAAIHRRGCPADRRFSAFHERAGTSGQTAWPSPPDASDIGRSLWGCSVGELHRDAAAWDGPRALAWYHPTDTSTSHSC